MELALVLAAALLAAAVQSASGFGQALVLAPVLFAVRPAGEALVALLATALLVNALVLGAERRRPQVDPGFLRRALVAGLPGLAAGAVVLQALPGDALQLAVGAAVVVAVAVRLARPSRPGRPRPAGDVAAGALAGALTTTTSISGPPLVLQLSRHGLSPAGFRDTLVAVLLALDVGALAVLALATPAAVGPGALLTALLVPSTLAGHQVGRRVFARADPVRFERAVLALALVAAVTGTASALL